MGLDQALPLQRQVIADTLRAIAGELHYSDLSGLYAAVGEGRISAQSVVMKLIRAVSGTSADQHPAKAATAAPRRTQRKPTAADSEVEVEVEGVADLLVRLSRCCTPVPGDEILGYVSHAHGVSVHRVCCVNAVRLAQTERERMVTVRWARSGTSAFLVAIQVEAMDGPELLSDVTRALSDQHVNVLSASVTMTKDQETVSLFNFEIGDPRHLAVVLHAIRDVDGVHGVYRINEKLRPSL